MCGEILSLPHTDTAANSTSPVTSAPGENPFILPHKNTEAGKREGGSQCLRTDWPLTFTVINNVVAQLEKKTPRLKEEAFLTHREGLRSEEPLQGLA